MSKKFYITTPIYYVNARPHIGHAYTTIACDTIARRQRMMGFDTYFLTGTDEHGQKIERAAQAAGKTPQQLTDEVSAEFRSLWDRMGLTYDDFIRTTSDKHEQGVQALWRRIRDNGYIYKGHYTGQYCVFDELYVDSVGPGAPCPECGRPTETVREENYFFKLSAFQDKLIELYTSQPDFIRPETRRNEVMSFVRSGLRDLSVSRSSISWGIPVPDDSKHVIYVWLDALANYITALGYRSDDPAKYDKYWPADVQMIGKEIVRFHCVYWPAFLLAAGLLCRSTSWPTAGCCSRKARCQSRAEISCALRPSSTYWAPTRCAIFCCGKLCLGKTDRFPSMPWCSAITPTWPMGWATWPAAP